MSREPSYLTLHRQGELARRAEALRTLEDPCTLCPRRCEARRRRGKRGVCGLGTAAVLARACLHLGEEPPLSGTQGAGTLFFAGCNLGCRFCQNHQISRDPEAGRQMSAQSLATEMLRLQEAGCHNISLVTPTPAIPAVVEALVLAADLGLRLPVVHNGSGYESLEALTLLHDVVDIYLPDLKYGDDEVGLALSGVPDYVARSREALLEMARQVGPLILDEDGLATRGLIIRHLILPGDASHTSAVLGFVATELGRHTAVSLMAQYRPPPGIHLPPPLDRPIDPEEHEAALLALACWGLSEGWTQALSSVDHYVPDFTRQAHPFGS